MREKNTALKVLFIVIVLILPIFIVKLYDFTLDDIDGSKFSLNDYRGKGCSP